MRFFDRDLVLSKELFKITIIIVRNAGYFKDFPFNRKK
ncbi:hypothetical protein HMPREF1141_0150 [Clostridium sp. MSTE9]|nr:hypothetical protein HMPREF1141_0150 [Clostridium sp. MSTE9]